MLISFEDFVTLFQFLLLNAGILIVFALISGRLIVKYPGFFLSIIAELFELFSSSFIIFLIKVLRLLALEFIFIWVLEHLYNNIFKIKAKQFLVLILCITFLIFSFVGLSIEELSIIIVLLLLVTYRIYYITKLLQTDDADDKWLLDKAKGLETMAYQEYCIDNIEGSLTCYNRALDIYRKPELMAKQKLDIKRAKLLEKIGTILYHKTKLDPALHRLNQALDIYKRPHIITQNNKDYVRTLRKTIKILKELGRKQEALQRYKLISWT